MGDVQTCTLDFRLLGLILDMQFINDPVLRSRLYSILPLVFKRNSLAVPWLEAVDGVSSSAGCVSPDDAESIAVDFSSLTHVTDGFSVGFIVLSGSPLIPAFQSACNRLGVLGKIFDPTCVSFLDEIRQAHCDCFLVRPEYKTALLRRVFEEKISALRYLTDVKIFPGEIELRVYESKRELAMFLEVSGIPHPETNVFFREHEALDFVADAVFPLVFKSNRGAASSGVEILETKQQAERLIRQIFRRVYFGERVADLRDFDYGYALFQEFLPAVREFRIIKIGESWFGHEKASGKGSPFMSGSGLNKWTPPSFDVLDFCGEIASKHKFDFMCFDVFQTTGGRFLINELQTWFGSFNDSQMYIDGVPGRYIKKDGEWIFQKGSFNVDNGLALRLSELFVIVNGACDD